MALHEIMSLIGKLRIRDDTDKKAHPNDELLFSKIRACPVPKYINLETGRAILHSSASKKKFINHDWRFCTDDIEQFNRFVKKMSLPVATKKAGKGPVSSKKASGKSSNENFPNGKDHKRKALPKTLKHHLWMRDYGNVAETKCVCCGVTSVTEATTEAGHITAFSQGGSNNTDNLRLICRTCNTDMGTQNMDEFMRSNNFPVKT